MGKRERRSFSEEFKREAVALATQSSESISGVAQQLGIASSSLTRWVRQAKAHGPKAFPGQGVARDEELMRLRRELAQVKKERDFCATRRRTSPGTTGEVRVYRCESGELSGAPHVPVAGGQAKRVLRMAPPGAEPPLSGQRTPEGRDCWSRWNSVGPGRTRRDAVRN